MKYSVLSCTCHYITVRCQKIGYLPFYIEHFTIYYLASTNVLYQEKTYENTGKKIYKNIHLHI